VRHNKGLLLELLHKSLLAPSRPKRSLNSGGGGSHAEGGGGFVASKFEGASELGRAPVGVGVGVGVGIGVDGGQREGVDECAEWEALNCLVACWRQRRALLPRRVLSVYLLY
jgi:hypothetical protein